MLLIDFQHYDRRSIVCKEEEQKEEEDGEKYFQKVILSKELWQDNKVRLFGPPDWMLKADIAGENNNPAMMDNRDVHGNDGHT